MFNCHLLVRCSILLGYIYVYVYIYMCVDLTSFSRTWAKDRRVQMWSKPQIKKRKKQTNLSMISCCRDGHVTDTWQWRDRNAAHIIRKGDVDNLETMLRSDYKGSLVGCWGFMSWQYLRVISEWVSTFDSAHSRCSIDGPAPWPDISLRVTLSW